MQPRFVPRQNQNLTHRVQGAGVGLFVAVAAILLLLCFSALVKPTWASGAILWAALPGLSSVLLAAAMIALTALGAVWPRPFRKLRWPAILVVGLTAIGLLLDFGVSGHPAIAYWPDRIERRDRFERERWDLADIEAVEAACEVKNNYRRPDTARLVLEVALRDGERLKLEATRLLLFVGGWNDRAGALLADWAQGGVARRVRTDADGRSHDRPACVAMLWNQQDAATFAQSARWLDLDDAELAEAQAMR